MLKMLGLVMFLSVGAYAEMYHVVNIRSNDTLSVREGTNSRTYKVGDLPFNARNVNVKYCAINSRGYKWCNIVYNGYYRVVRGWVSARYIRPSYSSDNSSNYSSNLYRVIRIRSNDTLSVRVNAGTEYRKIDDLRYNARGIHIIRCKNAYNGRRWCKVSHPSIISGWVRSKYITRY